MIIKRYEDGKLVTIIEIDDSKPRPSIEQQDRAQGYRDRVYGCCNDWYKRNRLDAGAAYEQGQRDAERSEFLYGTPVRIYV